MTTTLALSITVFVLGVLIGFEVISKVPATLHTPLMSATNAISGISLVGSMVAAGAHRGTVATILGFFAVVCATTNIVGGFLITDRMLKMFRREPHPPRDASAAAATAPSTTPKQES